MPHVPSTRDTCNLCGRKRNDQHEPLVRQPCHVRAFVGEFFHLWRCSHCRTIHCLEQVDLDHYYAKYPSPRWNEASYAPALSLPRR